jgi:hypothetical protein
MVDYFSLALTHGLMALAIFRLMLRADLDTDPQPPEPAESGEPAEPDTRKTKGARRA